MLLQHLSVVLEELKVKREKFDDVSRFICTQTRHQTEKAMFEVCDKLLKRLRLLTASLAMILHSQ